MFLIYIYLYNQQKQILMSSPKKFAIVKINPLSLQPQKQGDSVAQLVEHIPFKDGVQGSNPC